MEIIYTCPRCGGDLQETMLALCPPQYMKECPKCGWNIVGWEEQPIRVPYDPMEHPQIVFKLATSDERWEDGNEI